jgi:predicted membrane protein
MADPNNPQPDWQTRDDPRATEPPVHPGPSFEGDSRMDNWLQRNTSARLIGAVFLIVAGVALFLNNIGLLPVHDIWRFWPLFLISVGIGKLLGRGTLKDRTWGVIEILFGLLFLSSNLHLFSIRLNDGTWIVGLILVATGVMSLISILDPTPGNFFPYQGFGRRLAFRRRYTGADAPPGSDRLLNEVAVFGNIKRRVEATDFLGGNIQSVFGSVELDLRLALIASGTAVVRIHCVFGAVKLVIPTNWSVAMRIVGAFGAAEDKTLPATRTDVLRPTLVLTGECAFGAVEVLN